VTTTRVVEGPQGLLFQIDRAQIVVRGADEPNAVIECLRPRVHENVDLLAVQADPSADNEVPCRSEDAQNGGSALYLGGL
jgi:hypothetical protein